ncbi:MAG: hypothetical protein KME35_15225 [Aphanocapsa sp. GSE-SYN-MK-11-07L]|jgi:hypothetical protein|nr:hypothetical protein [Aphanocapsa sp. GSE-SYN-MK-11-07L]
MPSKNPKNHETRWPKGKGLTRGRATAAVTAEIEALLNSLPNRSEFIRQAIYEKIERDRLLPPWQIPYDAPREPNYHPEWQAKDEEHFSRLTEDFKQDEARWEKHLSQEKHLEKLKRGCMTQAFESEAEYLAFRAWCLEGSCIQQRMSSGKGAAEFKIPLFWKNLKKVGKFTEDPKSPKSLAIKLPPTLVEFQKKYNLD